MSITDTATFERFELAGRPDVVASGTETAENRARAWLSRRLAWERRLGELEEAS